MRLWPVGLAIVGCVAAHEPPVELLECPESPYVGDRFLWRGESPPRGRIWACEACARVEEEALARQVALGCPLEATHAVCALTGACDYAELRGLTTAIAGAPDCDALSALTAPDPCVRPDPRVYWRAEGD